MRHREWGAAEAWFCPCVFQPSPHALGASFHKRKAREDQRPEVSITLLIFRDQPRGPAPGPAALLLLVDFVMGVHAHLYHQRQILLEVDCTISIDIQLFEPGLCILFLSKLRRKKQSVKIRVGAEEWPFTWAAGGPVALGIIRARQRARGHPATPHLQEMRALVLQQLLQVTAVEGVVVPLQLGVLVVDLNEVVQGVLHFGQHGAQGFASPGRGAHGWGWCLCPQWSED